MRIVYRLEHTTVYRYRRPVVFGPHRAVFLPSGGYRGRVLSHRIETNIPHSATWFSDTLSNNVTVLKFDREADELSVRFEVTGEHRGARETAEFSLEDRARAVPVQYTPDEWLDLAAFIRPHAEDAEGTVAEWGRSFLAKDTDNVELLKDVMSAFAGFAYSAREAEGTNVPAITLRERGGTCRDYAWLMIETLRRLGFACRFVSGYLYDEALDGGAVGMIGSGATHAWVEVYLPGAGWRTYDPTNQISSGYELARVAVARHPAQVPPLSGTWSGDPSDYLGMDVRVELRKIAAFADDPQG